MNVHVSSEKAHKTDWEWQKPSLTIFLRSLGPDIRNAYQWLVASQRRCVISIGVLATTLVTLYIFRYVLYQPMSLNLRIYAMGIGLVLAIAIGSWFVTSVVVGKWLPHRYARFIAPIGAVLAAVLVVLGASQGKVLHEFVSMYWRYQTLVHVEPKYDPLTDHERIWSLDGIHTFTRRQMRDTEAPLKPHLVRDGKEYIWTMGIEPTTPLLRYQEPIDEVVSISSTVKSFELKRGKNVHFEAGETLLFSRNVHTCTQRRMWFWQAATYKVAANVIYLKNDAGKLVQVVPVVRWAGWFFPRPEFGGVFVMEQTTPQSWIGERLASLRRVFWGCGTWIGPREIAKHPYLVGQNLVPFEVTRYMAWSLRFRNGFWAPTWLRKEGDVRIADMPDDQNEQPFTLFFHIRNDAGEIVASKLYQYVALEPYDAGHQGHAAELLHPADGIGPSYVFQFFGERESLTGVTAVPGWVRNSKKFYDWSTNLPNEHRPYIRDIADSNGVVKTRRMWLTAVVTVDKKKYEEKDPSGFITGAPEIVITDALKNRSVWVGENPEKWPDEIRSELGPKWAGEQ